MFLAEEAHDGRRLREVALKLFYLPAELAPGSPEAAAFRDRILDEARALCRVEHPNVVRFHAVHRDDARGVLGLAMEHVRGEGLDVRLQRGGPLGDDEVAEVGTAVAWALSAVHDAGLVHGDVKPSNVVRGPSGYKLIDFGIAAEVQPDTGEGSPLAGTLGYIAPERFLGSPPSPATDLYALGATLYRLRWGAMPPPEPAPDKLSGETSTFDAEAAERHAPAAAKSRGASAASRSEPSKSEEASEKADHDPELRALLARLLARDPHARPRHAAWTAAELAKIHARLTGAPSTSESRRPQQASAPSPGPVAAPVSISNALCAHPALVGREAALEALKVAAERATSGHLHVTLVRGPQGSGRTRTLDAAIADAAVTESRVLRGTCSPERRSPFLALARALEAVPGARGLAALEEALEEALAPETLRASRDARTVVEAVEEALLWAAAAEPLVLAIDDAQWGDAHTLTLLALLCDRARAGSQAKLFVVVTARDEPRPSAELRALVSAARSHAGGATATMTLGPLSGDELAKVAEGVGPLAPEVARAVVRGAGGSPFFVVHALFAWRDTGVIAWREGAWRAPDPAKLDESVPGVAELVEARLASAFEADSGPARAAPRALAAVALYGGGLGIETLLAVCGDEASTEAALETLADMGLLVVQGPRCEHSFAQEMIRQAVRNMVRARPWFLRLHRALLQTLAELPEAQVDAAFLAAGYDALGDAPRARTWLRKAIQRAVRAGLLAEAVAMGDRMAALADGPAARAEAQLDTVRALIAGRRFEEADVRLRLVETDTRQRGLPPRSDLRRRIQKLQITRGLNKKADDASLLGDADASGDLVLRCEARLALAGALGGDRAVTLASEAVLLAEGGDPALEYAARVERAELIYESDTRDLALAHRDLTRALAIAEATASRLHRLQIESDLATIEAEQGHTAAAIERFAKLESEAEAHGMRGERRRLLQNRAAFLLREGRAAEAATAATEAARLAREAGDPALCAAACSIRADALRRTGDFGEALASVDEALRLQEELGDRHQALSLLRRAELALALGRAEEGARDAARAETVARGHGHRGMAIAAALWQTLHSATFERATAADLERSLEEAAATNMARDALVRSIMSRARAWLDARPPNDSRAGEARS